jgi:hypothetical protein
MPELSATDQHQDGQLDGLSRRSRQGRVVPVLCQLRVRARARARARAGAEIANQSSVPASINRSISPSNCSVCPIQLGSAARGGVESLETARSSEYDAGRPGPGPTLTNS